LILISSVSAIVAHESEEQFGELKFEENKGQLPSHILFRTYVPGGAVFLEGQTLTFNLTRLSELEAYSKFKHGEDVKMPDTLHGHAFKIHLKNSQKPSSIEVKNQWPDYVNYYLGDDESTWASGVAQYSEIIFRGIYPGIDVRYYSINQNFKYDFIIHPGADPSLIQMEYEGVNDLKLGFGSLLIETSVEQIVDQKPVSWIGLNENKRFIESSYRLSKPEGNPIVSFDVESNNQEQVTIDPTLIFSSYTGSTINNWGSTATYDSLGNMYAGGYMLSTGGSGAGYPTTTGAYQVTFAGGTGSLQTDMAISKFNASGNALVYSTYLGGNGNEIPHSLVVNDDNELYVLGTTSSTNFPTSAGAFDGTFNGGTTIGTIGANSNSSQIQYTGGSDIVITKFNAFGTALLGSTYVGGSGNDGINMSDTLQKAYSDEFRGEIIVDQNDNCYVATSTGSSDFPIVNGFQNTYGGGITDGVIFKFNSNLSALLWSSFIGGAEADAAYSAQFDPNFNVFCTGGTISTNFPTTAGVIHTSYQGGITDGWLAKISNNGQTLLSSTFIGTNDYDQSFFVQLDLSGFVYVVGQTLGNYPITPASVYSVNNSGQFLHKLTNNLQSTIFSTQWGSGNGNINLSLTAFLVNECNNIFVSGWGGSLFGVAASTSPGGTTTTGLPTTTNAYKPTTDGHDFYFIVFEDSAASLLFASFFGGNTGNAGGEHTDGGTSRFDKKGIIYQSACASCGQASSFPTTTGAYATAKPASASCNLAALKYDLVTLIAEVDINGPAEVCVDDSLQFINDSFGGSLYMWDFGDGTVSDEFEPKHAYSNVGTYDVVLVIMDSVSCVFSDTDSIQVTVNPGPIAVVPNYPKVCAGDLVQLNASGGDTYSWSPSTGLSDPNIANPVATVTELKTYVVSVEDSCGVDTAWVTLRIFPDNTDAIGDTSICQGLSGELWSSGGVSYSWSPGFYLSSTNVSNPIVSPDSTIDYTLSIIDSFGCEKEYPITVFVDGFVPQVQAWGDTSVCSGDRILLTAKGAAGYEWFPKETILNPFYNSTPAYPEETTTYVVIVQNSCGKASDSVQVIINPINLNISVDTAVCFGDTVNLSASGSYTYKWSGPAFEVPSYSARPSITPAESGWYKVEGSNLENCSKSDSLYVEVFPMPELKIASNEDTITGLENVLLVAESNAENYWSSKGYLPCINCDSILVYPRVKTVYKVQAIDSNGCSLSDSISVSPISLIFAPNAFSPDGDGVNDLFRVKGHHIDHYQIQILNRWGEEVYRSNDISAGWNGKKYNLSSDSPIGSYTFKIEYSVYPIQELFEVGTINLIR
jgi:gliding motility-associated-like protein